MFLHSQTGPLSAEIHTPCDIIIIVIIIILIITIIIVIIIILVITIVIVIAILIKFITIIFIIVIDADNIKGEDQAVAWNILSLPRNQFYLRPSKWQSANTRCVTSSVTLTMTATFFGLFLHCWSSLSFEGDDGGVTTSS